MRHLCRALYLLVPLATASFLPTPSAVVHKLNGPVDRTVADRSFTNVRIQLPSHSEEADEQLLYFRLDVLHSTAACGYGNITIDGKSLPQAPEDNSMIGKGPFPTHQKDIVEASWTFNCVKLNGEPDSQTMKLMISSFNGKAVEGVGLTVFFRQTGSAEILALSTESNVAGSVTASHGLLGLNTFEVNDDVPQHKLDDEIAELHWMRYQLRELNLLIAEKEEVLSRLSPKDFSNCRDHEGLWKIIACKARKATLHLVNKVGGGRRNHFELPYSHFRPINALSRGSKPGDCVHSPLENGGYVHPRPPPYPPYPLPRPVCRYQSPPQYQGGSDDQAKLFKQPYQDRQSQGSSHDVEARPHHPPHGRPTPPQLPNTRSHDRDYNSNHPASQYDQEEYGRHRQHGGKSGSISPPPISGQGHQPEFHKGFHKRSHDGSDNGFFTPGNIAKFTVIMVPYAFILTALHRYKCRGSENEARKTTSDQCRYRRGHHGAAKQHILSRFLARLPGKAPSNACDDDGEKGDALLSDAEDGISTTMTEELTQLRNAVSLVGDVVAEEGRQQTCYRQLLPSDSLAWGSQINTEVKHDEELPSYESSEGSENDSIIADGFRYLPGDSRYNPDDSVAGSANDILGPDAKQ